MEKINVEFNLPVSVFREGKNFVAYTPALDLSTSADNYDKVRKRFEEIVEIFFEETIKKGNINSVLKDLGWSQIKKRWTPPTVVCQELEKIKIPLNC